MPSFPVATAESPMSLLTSGVLIDNSRADREAHAWPMADRARKHFRRIETD